MTPFDISPALLKIVRGLIKEQISESMEALGSDVAALQEELTEIKSTQKEILAGLESRGFQGIRSRGKQVEGELMFSKGKQSAGKGY